jgi:hypothetical protein
MGDTGSTRRHPASRALKSILLILAALVLLPVGCVSYVLFHTDVWEGDMPAVIRWVEPGFYLDYGVSFTAPLPADALNPDAPDAGGGSVWPSEPSRVLEGAEVGEPVTCRVRQTYQVNTNIGSGPRTEIVRCWR